jgi:hypothetical protein
MIADNVTEISSAIYDPQQRNEQKVRVDGQVCSFGGVMFGRPALIAFC